MKFSYSSIISAAPGSGDFLLIHRPEIPVTLTGSARSGTYIGLVDTGSDHTIFPASVAHHLGITVQSSDAPPASVFGGHHVDLLVGEAALKLEADGQSLSWRASICFFDFASADEEVAILGHSGFLEYFTATFDAKRGTLELVPNENLPVSPP